MGVKKFVQMNGEYTELTVKTGLDAMDTFLTSSDCNPSQLSLLSWKVFKEMSFISVVLSFRDTFVIEICLIVISVLVLERISYWFIEMTGTYKALSAITMW